MKKNNVVEETLKEKVKKNTISSLAFFILTFPIMFIVTPLILKFAGKEAYGIWAITATIIAFLEFIGLQTPTALSINIPKYDLKKGGQEINGLLNTLFVFYIAMALLVIAGYFGFQSLIIQHIFKADTLLIDDARFVLTASILLYLFNFVILAFAYISVGFNLVYPANIMHIIIGWLRLGAFVWVLIAGYGIKGVAVVQGISIIVETIALIIWMKIVYPPLAFNPLLFSFKKLKDLLGLSVKLLFTRLAVTVNYNIDKMVLAYFVNPIMVAYYQIGSGIAKYITMVSDMLGVTTLVPAAAELKNKNEFGKLFNLYSRINKYIFFLAIFFTVAIIIFGKEFIYLWLGSGYETVYQVMVFLSVTYCISLIGTPAMQVLNGLEHVNSPMIAGGLTALLNIILSIILVKYFGLTGALIGTGISMSIGALVMYYLFYKRMKKSINVIDTFLKPLAASFVAAGFLILVGHMFPPGWMFFFLKAFIFSIIYLFGALFIFKQFDWYDLDLIKGYLPFLKKVL